MLATYGQPSIATADAVGNLHRTFRGSTLPMNPARPRPQRQIDPRMARTQPASGPASLVRSPPIPRKQPHRYQHETQRTHKSMPRSRSVGTRFSSRRGRESAPTAHPARPRGPNGRQNRLKPFLMHSPPLANATNAAPAFCAPGSGATPRCPPNNRILARFLHRTTRRCNEAPPPYAARATSGQPSAGRHPLFRGATDHAARSLPAPAPRPSVRPGTALCRRPRR